MNAAAETQRMTPSSPLREGERIRETQQAEGLLLCGGVCTEETENALARLWASCTVRLKWRSGEELFCSATMRQLLALLGGVKRMSAASHGTCRCTGGRWSFGRSDTKICTQLAGEREVQKERGDKSGNSLLLSV